MHLNAILRFLFHEMPVLRLEQSEITASSAMVAFELEEDLWKFPLELLHSLLKRKAFDSHVVEALTTHLGFASFSITYHSFCCDFR